MEILFSSHPRCSEEITMKFCTLHDSCTVVACAKFWSDMIPCNGVIQKLIFHLTWITMEKLFMKWALDPLSCWHYGYWNIPGEKGQYHGCWCPGTFRHQVISSHSTDCVRQIGPCFVLGMSALVQVMACYLMAPIHNLGSVLLTLSWDKNMYN